MTSWIEFRVLDLLDRIKATDHDKMLIYAMWQDAVYGDVSSAESQHRARRTNEQEHDD